MFGYSNSVVVFSVGACVAWAFALGWALSQPDQRYRWYQVWILSLATVFWWLGESIAIRLGKYHYPNFPLRIPFPWGGTPAEPGNLQGLLVHLLPRGVQLSSTLNRSCTADTWSIPFPVIAIEAAVLFGLFRLARNLLAMTGAPRWRQALATGGLSGILMVNLAAVLDPVVSTSKWCDTVADPGYHFMHFGLWQWFTTAPSQGYWFGVPLVNYAAWFLTAGTFSFLVRFDEDRNPVSGGTFKVVSKYVLATAGIIPMVFLILIPVKVGLDHLMVNGQEYLFGRQILSGKFWQFGLILAVLALGLIVAFRGTKAQKPQFALVAAVPKGLAFAFCLGLLVIEPDGRIIAVWIVTAIIALVALLWAVITGVIRDPRKPTLPGDSSPGSGVGDGA
jgi:hypothetical protein